MRNLPQALGLFCFILQGSLVGCRSLVLNDYKQAQLLADAYTRHYKPNQKNRTWYGPAPALYSPRRRIHPQQPAILVGHVVRLEADGTTAPQPGALIILKQKALADTDESGTYVLSLPPGTHTVNAGAIGFLTSKPISIKVREGDSIRLNFPLMPDLRPIIHTLP